MVDGKRSKWTDRVLEEPPQENAQTVQSSANFATLWEIAAASTAVAVQGCNAGRWHAEGLTH